MATGDYPTVTYGGGRSSSRVWWVVGILLVLLVLAAALALRVAFAQLPPGTTLAGIDVRTPTAAQQLTTEIATALVDLPVELTTAAGTTTVPAGRLGATLDTQALRQASLDSTGFDAWSARFTGGGPVALPLQVSVSSSTAPADVVEAVSRQPVDGAVQITPAGVEVTDPVVGVDVTAEAIQQAVAPAIQALAQTPLEEWPDPLAIEVQATEIEPLVNAAAVEGVVQEVERLTGAPIQVTAQRVPEDGQTVDSQGIARREEFTVALGAADLRSLLSTEVDPAAVQVQRLRVITDISAPPVALTDFLADAAVVPEMDVRVDNRSATPPRDASGTGPGGPADQPRLSDLSGITGDLVAEVVTPGLTPDLQATADAILGAADRGETTAAVAGTPVADADPALLGITAPVGTYTTFFNPGEGRNTNIQRVAELVDGAMIPPGGNYEVNHAVGERTVEKGFVEGGAILEGEFVTDVGGGVSQFATTFFNAMWFAGHDIITHTPHSFYIDRYPAGREATMDYPGVNLELNNNSPYWILVDTTSTDDSVTVTLWSTPYYTVEQSIGPREPVAGSNFRISINRSSTAPAIPELQAEAVDNSDQFTHTYRAQ